MKQKKELAVLAVLLVVAVVVWVLYFQRNKDVVTADAGSTLQNYQLLSGRNPKIRFEKLEESRKTEYKSSGRNIFSAVAPIPQPQTRLVQKEHPTVEPPPVEPQPPPPSLPVKFFGYGTVPNGTVRSAFFTDGEGVEIVPEGEVLMNRFLILKVGNASVEFEEITSGRRNTAPLEEQGVPPSS